MIRWILGISELIISIAALLGLSLIGKSLNQFCIEQFIILSPHIINYACSITLGRRYITYMLNSNDDRYELYKHSFILVNIIVSLALFISLIGLFISISSDITLSGGRIIIMDDITILSKHLFPIYWIIAFDVYSLIIMDPYSIKTILFNNEWR